MEVILENFNSHVKSTFVIPNGELTVVTGENDQGKSSALQGIYWVVTNNIQGDKFIHFGKDFAAVTIIRDNWSIRKERDTKGKTKYTVIIDGVKEEYFKTDVPAIVEQLFGLKNIKFVDNELNMNFWFQHDNLFLLSEASSYNAQFFGYFAGTDVLDKVIKNLQSDVLNFNRQQKTKISEQYTLKGKLDKLETVDLLSMDLSRLEEKDELLEKYIKLVNKYSNTQIKVMEASKDCKKNRIDYLGALSAQNITVKQELYTLNFRLELKPLIEKSTEDMKKLIEKNEKLSEIKTSNDELNTVVEAMQKLNTSITINSKLACNYTVLNTIVEKNKRKALLESMKEKRSEVIAELGKAYKQLDGNRAFTLLENNAKQIGDNMNKIMVLSSLLTSHKSTNEKLVHAARIELMKATVNTVDIVKVAEKIAKIKKLKVLTVDLQMSQSTLNTVVNLTEKLNTDLLTVEKEYHDKLHEIGECPLCGTIIKGDGPN
jgi:hypothetical protein